MSDFEQMPMEPEHQENLFIQILQDMEKLDLMSSEFGGLSIPVKILIGVLIVMIMVWYVTVSFLPVYDNS